MTLSFYIYKKVKCECGREKNLEDVYIEFDGRKDPGAIEMVEVWNETAGDWVPVDMASKKPSALWLMKLVRTAVDKRLHEILEERVS